MKAPLGYVLNSPLLLSLRRLEHKETLRVVGYVFLPYLWWLYHGCLHISKLIKLCILNMCSSLFINYTSIKLFFKKSLQNVMSSCVLFPSQRPFSFFSFSFYCVHVSGQLVVSSDFWNLDWSSACSCPLLIFINSKSGDHQGIVFLRKFKQYLNPSQVFDLSKGGPEAG